MKWGSCTEHHFTSIEEAARHALRCEKVTAKERDGARHQLLMVKIEELGKEMIRTLRTPVTDRLALQHEIDRLKKKAKRLYRKSHGIKGRPMPPELLDRLRAKKREGGEGQ